MEQIILNLVPGGVSPVCYVSQYDVGRKIRLHLRNGSDPYVLSGAETVTATIRKVSGEELIYDIANTSASYVDLIVNYDATDVIGESVCELIITESGTRLGSANFKMRVDPDVYSGDQKLEVVTASSPNSSLSFETNIDENLLELKAGFSPVQDLHGYDHPWPAGSGKNKLNAPNPITINTGATADTLVGTVNVTSGETYTVSCNQQNAMTSNERNTLIVVINGNRIYESSNSNYHLSSGLHTLTFTATASGECEVRMWGHTLSTATTYDKFQFEVGSQATAYEPYSNICPIEGWNEVNVVRTGENLIPTIEPQTGSASNVTAIVGEDGVITLNGTSNANGSIILETNNAGLFAVPMIDDLYVQYFNNFENGSIALVFELNDGTNFGPSFNMINKVYKIPTESLGKVVWRIRIYFLSGQSFNNAKFSPMITIGNSETTYKKYDEVQTINLDWNTNQWDENLETDTYINSNTGAAYPETGRCVSSFIPLLYNKIYLKIPDSTGNWRICYYKADKTYLGSDYSIVVNVSAELTIPEGAYYMRFGTGASYGTTYNHDISINYPSTDHTYHPYRGHGVAYSGEIVYKDGVWKLRLLSAEVDLGSILWYAGNENGRVNTRERIAKYITSATDIPNLYCSKLPNISARNWYQNVEGICICGLGYGSDGTIGVCSPMLVNMSASDVKTALTGYQLVYPLATPIEIPLDQNSKLATVLDINNLMHDANGGTEVKFFRMISAS